MNANETTTIKFKKVCNGVYLDGALISKEARTAVEAAFPKSLERFIDAMTDKGSACGMRIGRIGWTDMAIGSRCSVSGVLGRLSGIPSEEVLSDPEGWILDALRDCASADYWYAFEKDWGD